MEAQINGVKLHYEDQGEGMPIVLVHAFPLSGELWRPQVEALLGKFRFIVPDMRGFGESDVPAGPYTMETYADDVAALLDHLGIEKVVLGGVSMGGYITFAFLRRYAARLRALVLADTRATADAEQAKEGRETNAQLAEKQGSGAIADMMIPNLLAEESLSELRTHVRGIIRSNQPQGIAGALRGMALRPDSTDLLAQITIPTLLAVGEHDTLTTPDEMRAMHEAIAGSTLVEIPHAAHLSNLENPQAFNQALVEFLAHV
jgi:pimeloyl-ACP methyl ester carboxylesterase